MSPANSSAAPKPGLIFVHTRIVYGQSIAEQYGAAGFKAEWMSPVKPEEVLQRAAELEKECGRVAVVSNDNFRTPFFSGRQLALQLKEANPKVAYVLWVDPASVSEQREELDRARVSVVSQTGTIGNFVRPIRRAISEQWLAAGVEVPQVILMHGKQHVRQGLGDGLEDRGYIVKRFAPEQTSEMLGELAQLRASGQKTSVVIGQHLRKDGVGMDGNELALAVREASPQSQIVLWDSWSSREKHTYSNSGALRTARVEVVRNHKGNFEAEARHIQAALEKMEANPTKIPAAEVNRVRPGRGTLGDISLGDLNLGWRDLFRFRRPQLSK